MHKSTTGKRYPQPFVINNYKTWQDGGVWHLAIEGQKFPPPSKRIILYQKNIKVLDAKIIYKSKKGDIEYEIARINRIKSFGEIRLHTANILYPGNYEVSIEFSGKLEEQFLKRVQDDKLNLAQ